ncbi:hypothetical protein BD626DRAFT_625811 [Schizophyllum amplum]|uniref:F-box domain-containing protein n=1 Tax=Schizophyllum amplum TaxID=97359 RepID=A0A550CRA2_9AGAR|nr:hypothetical protein BD626DRAFT_625811 [Auriculariopsis ampla]
MGNLAQAHLDALISIRNSILEEGYQFDEAETNDLKREIRLALRALKFAENARVPINKLPTEILERIFKLVQPHYGDFVPRWPNRSSSEWTSVTRVCKRWRNVAIAYSALWSTIDLCHNYSAAEGRAFLAHSGDAPLAVFFSSKSLQGSLQDVSVLKDILTLHIARLEQLHLAFDSAHDIYRICALMQYPAPMLQSLSIICLRTENYGTEAPVIFAGECSTVRKLAVYHFPIWQANTFANLTHLAVYGPIVLGNELFAVLHGSPNLEKLALNSIAIRHGLRPDDLSICSTRLRALQWSQYDFESGIPRLDIPEACQISVSEFLPRYESERGLFSTLSTNSPRPLHQPIHTIQLRIMSSQTVRLAINCGTALLESGASATLPRYSFHLTPNAHLIVIRSCSNGGRTYIRDEWARFLSPLTPVRSLTFIHDSKDRCPVELSLFDMLSSTSMGASSEAVILPELQELRVYGAQYAIWPCLWSLVAHRARIGVPLRRVYVYEDPVPEKRYGIPRRYSPGSLRIITLDASGTPVQVTTEKSDVVAADIVAQMVRDAEPWSVPADGTKWADDAREETDEEEGEEDDDDDDDY